MTPHRVTVPQNPNGHDVVDIGGFQTTVSGCLDLALHVLKKMDAKDPARQRFLAEANILSGQSVHDAQSLRSAIAA